MKEVTPEQQERAGNARELAIYTRWLNGARMTAVDLREIRNAIGEERYKRSMEAIGETPEPLPTDAPTRPPSYPLGRSGHAKELSEYEKVFSTRTRQLKRYNEKGRNADPPDLPPFDHPEEMADWWVKHYPERKVPKKFLVLKLDHAKGGSAGADNQPSFAPMNIRELTMQKGASVDMAERYVVATHTQLLHGYEFGNDAIIRVWQPRFYEALDALRKAEASERQAAKIRGDLVPKAQIFSDISTFLEMQRMMKEDAGPRVRKSLGQIPDELGDRIELAVAEEMEKQTLLLRQLPGYKTVEDFQLAIAS